MMLSDRDIRLAIADGRICLRPSLEIEDLRPTGVRVHLAGEVLEPLPVSEPVDIGGSDSPTFERRVLGPGGIILRRGDFLLGSSLEHVSTAPDLVCLVDGRSTLARLGLMVHCASATIDHLHGEFRSVTLELSNVGPFDLRLQSGMAVALLSFIQLTSPIEQPPNVQYADQSGPTGPILGTTRRKVT